MPTQYGNTRQPQVSQQTNNFESWVSSDTFPSLIMMYSFLRIENTTHRWRAQSACAEPKLSSVPLGDGPPARAKLVAIGVHDQAARVSFGAVRSIIFRSRISRSVFDYWMFEARCPSFARRVIAYAIMDAGCAMRVTVLGSRRVLPASARPFFGAVYSHLPQDALASLLIAR